MRRENSMEGRIERAQKFYIRGEKVNPDYSSGSFLLFGARIL